MEVVGLREKIEGFITDYIMSHNDNELFRKPLIGYSRADDERYEEIKKTVGPHLLRPRDILPTCKTVVSFFIPFTKKVVESNIIEGRTKVSYLWAKTYYECNNLINSLTEELVDYLKEFNVNGTTVPATHGFDKEKFVAPWSHKSAAVIAGLGDLGLHSLLITDKGCAGRIGTIFLDLEIEANDKKEAGQSRCLYYRDASCTKCVDNCPSNALSINGLNKKLCYKKLVHTDELYSDLGKCDSCGKCSLGPCAYYE